jgi:hypothetical protein
MYKPKHFQLFELIDPTLFHTLCSDYQKWMVFDERVLRTADMLRDRYGRMIANDWYWKGEYRWRGYRSAACMEGASFSQHRFGRALDINFLDATAREVREDILSHPYLPAAEFITCIELDVSWFHFDVRNNDSGIMTM